MKGVRNLGMLMLGIIIFGFGCLENQNPNSSNNAPPEIPQLIIFKGPLSPNAPESLKNSIDEFNSHLGIGYTYLSIAMLSDPEIDENRVTWEVTAGGFSGTIIADKKENGTADWQVTVDGTDGTISYHNWVVLQGNAKQDGTTGVWHVFAENSTELAGVFSWTTDTTKVKAGSFSMVDSDVTYEIVNNPDKSGSFAKKETGVKVYEAIWQGTGSGNWYRYDNTGNVVSSGSWA